MAPVVFMGTPDFAVPALRALLAAHEVAAVVTQPDRPAGRNRQLQASPVKQVALEAGVPVLQPEKLRRPEAVADLCAYPADVFVVAAFGQILPQAVLDMPARGALNIHASLLPRWRGAAPINAAILAGDAESGVTIMQMDAGLDTGPILTQAAVPLAPDETARTLHDRLSALGADLLIETLPGYLGGRIPPRPQDDARATLAPRIDKEAGHIDWSRPAVAIERAVRAFTPWPGTFTAWDGRQLKIHAAAVAPGRANSGLVVRSPAGLAVGTGEGLLVLRRVQLEGRSTVSAEDFARGYPAFVGATLE